MSYFGWGWLEWLCWDYSKRTLSWKGGENNPTQHSTASRDRGLRNWDYLMETDAYIVSSLSSPRIVPFVSFQAGSPVIRIKALVVQTRSQGCWLRCIPHRGGFMGGPSYLAQVDVDGVLEELRGLHGPLLNGQHPDCLDTGLQLDDAGVLVLGAGRQQRESGPGSARQ